MKKELLFSIGQKDCRFDFYRGSGKGGQKRNKTSNAVRCTHLASGAVGKAEDTRSQVKNKQIAFLRMIKTDQFKKWHRIEVARKLGRLDQIKEWVDSQTKSHNILVEKKEKGRWVKYEGD